MDEDYFVDDPSELLGKPYHFKVTIRSAEINKARFSKGTQIKFRVYKDEKYEETPVIKGTLSPEYNFSKIFSYASVDNELLDFFDNGCITFLVYGTQEDQVADQRLSRMSTKELRQMEHLNEPNVNKRNTIFGVGLDGNDQSQLKSELVLLQRKYQRLEQKEKRMQEVCKEWEGKPEGEKQFEPFFRAVSAVANSTGTKLKTRVQVLNRILAAQKRAAGGNGAVQDKAQVQAKGKEKEGSKACIVM